MRIIAGFIALLVCASFVLADCAVRKRVFVRQAAVVEAVAVTPIVATTFVPVTVPAYSVTYAPGADAAELQKLKDEVKQLRDTLEKAQSHGFLKAMPPADGGAKKEPTIQDRAVALLQSRCASCHTGATAKKGFAIFQDGKCQVTPKLLGAAYRSATEDGKKMPPTGPGFTDEETAIILDGLGR